jgi:hypothetical protein
LQLLVLEDALDQVDRHRRSLLFPSPEVSQTLAEARLTAYWPPEAAARVGAVAEAAAVRAGEPPAVVVAA